MGKTAWAVAWLLLSGTHAPGAERAARTRDEAKRAKGRVVAHQPRPLSRTAQRLIGTIQYDTGVNAGFHPDWLGGNTNRTVGNRFNSALGGPLLMTGMLSMLTVFPANDGDQSVSIADAPTPLATAMVLVFVNAELMANQFNAITFNPNATIGADFLGMFIGQYAAYQPLGLLGMSEGTLYGQGFHAVEAFYTTANGGLQTMIAAVPGRNAMLRATVDVLVPVELMDFRIQ